MKRNVLVVALALVLLVGGWFVYEFIDTDAPDEVSTQAALDQLAADSAVAADSDTSSDDVVDDATSVAVGAVGTWAIDDEFGDFGFGNASGSFAGFRVGKTFFAGGGGTAVGRSGGVSGELVISAGEFSSGEIVVDMTQMDSDEGARVKAIKDVIKESEHPTATFVVTSPTPIDTDALDRGETVIVDVAGELTIAGVTNSVTVPVEATIVDSGVGLIVGSTELVWADFGVETPDSSVATVADDGILEFQLVVRPA